MRPNLLSYNTCINAWAQSPTPDSAARAEALFTRMLRRYKEDAFSTVKPDVVTFSSVLNALAKSKAPHKGKGKVVQVDVFYLMPSYNFL